MHNAADDPTTLGHQTIGHAEFGRWYHDRFDEVRTQSWRRDCPIVCAELQHKGTKVKALTYLIGFRCFPLFVYMLMLVRATMQGRDVP